MARPVAIVGTGVIGASWAALFLAHGRDVQAFDLAPGAEAALREAVARHTTALRDVAPARPGRLQYAGSVEEAVEGAGFVQENGPERLDLKQELFRQLDAAAAPGVVIASSSSTLSVTQMQAGCRVDPGRVVLGHPFNPPHLIPLVEVVGGDATRAEAVDQAVAFYRSVGKHPIRLKREIRGHVANRLQAALWQEAFHLVREGVADVEDIDAAIAQGPGLRWALLGPFMNLHLSGGEGGLGALLGKPLWQATEGMWRDLGTVETCEPAVAQAVLDGLDREAAGRSLQEIAADRDRSLMKLLRLKQDAVAGS